MNIIKLLYLINKIKMIKENKNKEVFEFLIKEKRVSYIEVNDKIYVLQKLFPIDIF
jgi:hypothetical protein